MLVDVVRMRRRGEKIPRDELKRTPPVRGSLSVTTRIAPTRKQERVPVAMLVHPTVASGGLLPVLDHMRLTSVKGNEFVLQGIEELEIPVRQIVEFPQAWWCRLVLPDTEALIEAALEDRDAWATRSLVETA